MTDPELEMVTDAVVSIARAITPDASPGKGIDDSHIASLTEAVMDVAAGLKMIATAINEHTYRSA